MLNTYKINFLASDNKQHDLHMQPLCQIFLTTTYGITVPLLSA